MGILNAIKKFRWGYFIIATFLCTLGAFFIIYPNNTTKIVSYVIGACTAVFGLYNLIKTLANRKRGFNFAITIIFSAITIICGCIILFVPDVAIQIYPMIIGLFIIVDASFKLQTVINANKYKLKMWWFLLSFCILSIIGGFFLIRMRYNSENTKIYIILLGITMFIAGLQNFFSLFYLGKISVKASAYIGGFNIQNSTDNSVIVDSLSNTNNIDEFSESYDDVIYINADSSDNEPSLLTDNKDNNDENSQSTYENNENNNCFYNNEEQSNDDSVINKNNCENKSTTDVELNIDNISLDNEISEDGNSDDKTDTASLENEDYSQNENSNIEKEEKQSI